LLSKKNKKLRKTKNKVKKLGFKKLNLKNKTKKNVKKIRSNLRNLKKRNMLKRNTQKGGLSSLSFSNFHSKNMFNQTVPFVPPGGPYKVGSSTNGLDGGFYYKLSKDLHQPNGVIETSNKMNYPHQKGGLNIVPQEIVNLGRNAVYGLQNVYAGYEGQQLPASDNPNTMYQPHLEKTQTFEPEYLDLTTTIQTNNNKVNSIK